MDYAICLHGLCEKMEDVLIGEQLWDLKYDHKSIYLSFSWSEKKQIGTKTLCIQQPPSKGRILLTQQNCHIFKTTLERLFKKEKMSSRDLESQQLTN